MMHAPISIPELQCKSITWAMCRNPMCRHFGVPYDSEEARRTGILTRDANYTIASSKEGKLACRYCGQSFKPGSNEAIRPIARYFHSLSLPFATCRAEDCENYGVNVFENYLPNGQPPLKFYESNTNRYARCPRCNKNVILGESPHVSDNPEVNSSCVKILESVLLGVKKRRVVARRHMRVSREDEELPRINTSNYYSRLRRLGRRLGDYHKWLNARLLRPDSGVDFSTMARVSTDVITVPLRRRGDVHRSRDLRIIVSALLLERTYYILAAHPFFLPVKFGPKPEAEFIDDKTGRPSIQFAHQWDCLEHPVHNPFVIDDFEEWQKNLADVSHFHLGCYIRSPYAEAAHFLVVQKMLSRFDRVCFCLDAARDQRAAAMVALADGIRARRIEVVLIQRQYPKKKATEVLVTDAGLARPKEGSEDRRAALHKAWNVTEEQVQTAFAHCEIKPTKRDPNPSADRKAAHVYKSAFLTAVQPSGKWAWLDYPPPLGEEILSRSLWVTRMPGKTFEDAEEPLFHASLQRVESAMNAMRERLISMRRAGLRARPARSYRNSYFLATVVVDELAIYLLARNFTKLSEDQKLIPGKVLGLWPKDLLFPYHMDTFRDFQLGLKEAERLTEWLCR